MKGFFEPESVAVVGVSNSIDNLGWIISVNLQACGFQGPIYEVGPRGGSIFGRPIYTALEEVPGPVGLAVFLTPASVVPGLMEQCGRLGIKRVVIESGGFQEYGDEGAALSARVREIAARYGIRFIGPNCLGVFNSRNGLATAFGPLETGYRTGGISVLSQSGGVMMTILNALISEGLGVSKMVSMGNKLDVDESDLLEYLIDDPETQSVCMYLEGVGDGRRLLEVARRSAKPILVHKSNIGAAAGRIASSHTAALAADDRVVDAAFRQVGISRFPSIRAMIHGLKALALPPMRGNRVAIISRSGGDAVMAADECERTGLELAPLPESFLAAAQQRLRANVVRLTNPMDLGDLFDLDVYRDLVDGVLAMEQVDGLVFMNTYVGGPEGSGAETLFRKLQPLAEEVGKPVAAHADTSAAEVTRLKQILPGPLFDDPGEAVRALAWLRDLRRPETDAAVPAGPADRSLVAGLLDRGRRESRDLLLPEALAAAGSFGVPVAGGRLARDEGDAAGLAAEVGFPVALKVVGPRLSHKSDVGGVRLGLSSRDEVAAAYREMLATVAARAPGAAVTGVLVQPMAPSGRDMIVGARLDPSFGHVVLVGMGGIFVEVLGDAAMRVVPFGRRTAGDMLRELKAFPLLSGRRGEAPADIDSLVDVIGAVARLVDSFPEISELDLNPVRVFEAGRGCLALDARMLLGDSG